ncbi:hypothetical protein [Micromonospora sp. WMMD1155]|uniref:hypothetical protein n=1 Tax=Micromonospora sp. WMMD1155 TaxID=3016094 RepID=UPI00249BC3F2|nr:hypothetical protein [Micromonospora sp. WMMD1155]WFE53243.1 hypothetical protein O7617_24305 [Micromonospora sp. WMMD1155]
MTDVAPWSRSTSLLPPHLPHVPGVDIAVRSRRGAGGTAEVLGDFYDVLPSARDTWAVVVDDVCGKGPSDPSRRPHGMTCRRT